MKEVTTQACERGEDLIAFLYHELNERESRDFQQHLHHCANCERELSSFGDIRESIVAWRDASLGAAFANDNRQATFAAPPRRSALAAIREFFNLSPLWMKGATAFASLLFCACLVLAVAYLKRPNAPVVAFSNDKVYTQAELDKQVATAVQASEKKLRSELAKSESRATQPFTPQVPRRQVNRVAPPREAIADNRLDLRKPLTAQERKELAADLGLSTLREDDDDLDLVTDRIPQTP